ncbi:MAG: penicillin-insensitive murein endopeptidase, partial [Elusimicrobia bacterium]
ALPGRFAPLPVPARRDAPLKSASLGTVNRGRLVNAAELTLTGPHWKVIRPEIQRNFGTVEMVDGLIWAAERLRAADPNTPLLAVGDLSAASGGRAPRHRSHQNGRDADVNFYWTDESGAPLFSERMTSFDAKGRGVYGGKKVRFDVARNWKLVVAFLTNPYFGADVRWVFVSRGLRTLLLREAVTVGADAALVERAAKLMAQPPGSSHRNHFHVRIGCAASDALKGCRSLN